MNWEIRWTDADKKLNCQDKVHKKFVQNLFETFDVIREMKLADGR